jgi:COMPASS component SWD3
MSSVRVGGETQEDAMVGGWDQFFGWSRHGQLLNWASTMTDEMPMDVDSAPATVPSAEAEELPLPQMDVIIPDPPPIVASPPSATTSASVQPEPQARGVEGPRYKIRYSLSGHTMSISSLKFSPDGSKLASSGLL